MADLNLLEDDTSTCENFQLVETSFENDLKSHSKSKTFEKANEKYFNMEEKLKTVVFQRTLRQRKTRMKTGFDAEDKVGLTKLKDSSSSKKIKNKKKLLKSKGLADNDEKTSFSCKQCGLEFRFETHLDEHNQRNPECKSEKPVTFDEKVKSILDSKITFKDPLTEEIRTKTIGELLDKTEGPYICEVCQKSFDKLHALRRHVCQHSECRPFICNICYMGFNQWDNLRKHLDKHDMKPYHCSNCKRRYETPEKLRHHQQDRCIGGELTCSECGHQAPTL